MDKLPDRHSVNERWAQLSTRERRLFRTDRQTADARYTEMCRLATLSARIIAVRNSTHSTKNYGRRWARISLSRGSVLSREYFPSSFHCMRMQWGLRSIGPVLAACDNSGLFSRQLEPRPDLLAFFTKSNSTLSKPAKLRRSFLEIRTDLQNVEVPRSYWILHTIYYQTRWRET